MVALAVRYQHGRSRIVGDKIALDGKYDKSALFFAQFFRNRKKEKKTCVKNGSQKEEL